MGLFSKKEEKTKNEEEVSEELFNEESSVLPDEDCNLESNESKNADLSGKTKEEPIRNISPAEITDKELDQVADCGIEVLQSLLACFNLGDVTIDEYEGEDKELILDVTGNDLSILIGHHGKTLESLQFLVSIIVGKKLGFRYPLFVDVEGYKNRRRQKIEKIAISLAQKAVRQGKSVSMRPSSSYERRIVHVVLKDNSEVETHSEGEGRNRHLVITPISNE